MNNEIIDRINNITDGDEVTFSIPIGSSSFNVSGVASVDSNGDVVIKSNNKFNTRDLSIENGVLTIERKKGLSYGDEINISINGDGNYGGLTENINDLKINIRSDQVTISNSPFDVVEGTYELPDAIQFDVEKVESTGQYGEGETVSLAEEVTSELSTKEVQSLSQASDTSSSSVSSGTNKISFAGSSGGGGSSRKTIGNTIAQKVAETTGTVETNSIKDFVAKDHSGYWKDEYQKILDNTSDVNYDTLSQQLKSDVEFLSNDFSKVKDQMTNWMGSTSGATKDAVGNILDKFQCTMDNINNTVGPACTKIEDFKKKLENLKKGKEELTGADGNGGLDKELKDLTKDYEDKESAYSTLKNSEPSVNRQVSSEDGKTRSEHNPDHDTWETNVANAKSAMDTAYEKVVEKQNQIKAKEAELDALLDDVSNTYSMIQELVSSIKTFKDYFGSGSKSNMISSAESLVSNLNTILADMGNLSFSSNVDYSKASKPVLADLSFFEGACKKHASEGWKIENGVVTMVIDGKTCTYDTKRHIYSTGDKNTEIQTYIYLPSHIVEAGDYSALEKLNTYTYFSTSQNMYVNAIDKEEINTITMKVIKQDPFNSKYDTVASLTKMANTVANTDLSKCENVIGGDSVYGAHSLKIAASTGNLYKTVYCIDNAAIVTGYNGKAGTKEQFDSIDQLKGLDGKNIYFINTSGDDNYAMGADMSIERGRAYVPVGSGGNISVEQVKNSFTYSGIDLVAQTCPNAKIHIVYQDQDTAKSYQSTNFPIALDQLADKYPNVWNDSKSWDDYISKKYKTHSEGNYIAADLASAASTKNPTHVKDSSTRA